MAIRLGPQRQGQNLAVIWVIFALCLLPELAMLGNDAGLWGQPGWRQFVYQNGAFWPGLLDNWRPNYPGQKYAMFLTYGFLHAGPSHFILNMLTLFALAPPLLAWLGARRFLYVWVLSTLGGAIAFGLLSSSPRPMVGASGALFGLAGAVLQGEMARMMKRGMPGPQAARRMAWPVIVLIILNLVSYWATGGLLAWQTHLGGFLAGWITCAVLTRQERK